jgi:hypothetical protein
MPNVESNKDDMELGVSGKTKGDDVVVNLNGGSKDNSPVENKRRTIPS